MSAEDTDVSQHQIWVATSREKIKTIKTVLETFSILDKKHKIWTIKANNTESFIPIDSKTTDLENYDSLIPTTISIPSEGVKLFPQTRLREALSNGTLRLDDYGVFRSKEGILEHNPTKSINPLGRAVQAWLSSLLNLSPAQINAIITAESWSYQVYSPLLLLGPSAFSSQEWLNILNASTRERLPELYSTMCSALGCTHIAVNAPIPSKEFQREAGEPMLNILRSPSNLIPLHGDFGSISDTAAPVAFEKALWIAAKHNSLTQIWAPMYTMFSRGNIKEKARILDLASGEKKPYSAVDLYVGIGYFAFSYAKGGADAVLGWDINPWSVEGFKRGATANGWETLGYHPGVKDLDSIRDALMHRATIREKSILEDATRTSVGRCKARQTDSARHKILVIFEESNEFAPERLDYLRHTIPPVKHVNCGYLPSSKDIWQSAILCLDSRSGGCIHAHENVGSDDIDSRRTEIIQIFQSLANSIQQYRHMLVDCQHVERVKSYAPGVIHCVFDVHLRP